MGKVTSHAAISRVNVCRTIALKHQLILNYRLLCQELSNEVLTVGQQKKISFEQLPHLDEFHHFIWMPFSTYLLTTDWVCFYSKKITLNSKIMIFGEDGLQFFDIYTFILNEKNDFQAVVRHMHDCFFDEHFEAFRIYDLNNFSWHVLSSKNITEATFTTAHKLRGGHYYTQKNWM